MVDQPRSVARCAYCRAQIDPSSKSRDHLFPDFIGGTLDLQLPACATCNNDKIGKAETHLARRTIFTFHRHGDGLQPRKKNDPTSGLIDGTVLLEDPVSNSFTQVKFRVGTGPETLPQIQVDLATGHALVQGDDAKLVGTIRTQMQRRDDGSIALPVRINFVKTLPEATSAEYRPRIYLDGRDKLWVGARDINEAARLVGGIIAAVNGRAFDRDQSAEHPRWEVPGPAHLHFQLEYDPVHLHRLAAKIAYGALYLQAPEQCLDSEPLDAVRAFILGERDMPDGLVAEVDCDPGWPDDHLVVLYEVGGYVTALVQLYESRLRVKLPVESAELVAELPVVAACRRDGSETRWSTKDEARRIPLCE